MEEKIKALEKRIADIEKEVQNQQKEFDKALVFLFDRSEYKELIKQKKLEYPKMLTAALKEYFNIYMEDEKKKEAPEVSAQEQNKNKELLALITTVESLISKVYKIIKNDING